ncbi:MAG: hypothetical protein L0K03_02580, partial [Bifidobacterium crudilactis]|nr:hypothetical protein [Bifidobacterium crudilactis]
LNITEGTTIVMVLHDVNLAARYADWILAMHEGRCEALGAPSEILTEGLVQQVFGIHAAMIADPVSGLPMMIADRGHSLQERRQRHSPHREEEPR